MLSRKLDALITGISTAAVACGLAIVVVALLAHVGTTYAAGSLSVEIIAAHNLVVDSNATSNSTYAPSVATVIGKYCNTGDAPLTDVQGYIGEYDGTTPANSTPGTYPVRDSASFDAAHPLFDTGLYSFTHVGGRIGTADATRYVGTLAPGECTVQYWHFTYPRCANVDDGSGSYVAEEPPCSTTPVWGSSVKPEDDLWLEFDVWGDSAEGSRADATHRMTMRNEISAMANKIEPNPSGRWFNTDTSIIRPGEVITSNGVLYELGNVNKGFDNDGDGVYDYNAWLQPVGDPNYDPSCFRLIRTTGVVTVSRSSGKPDMVIPFTDKLYFTNLPADNTGVVGDVRYTFLALDGPCVTRLTPYQEVASGADNEKFNADYGTGIPPVGSSEPRVTIDKFGTATVTPGNAVTYDIPFENTGTGDAGLPLASMPLVISDTIPDGLEYTSSSYTYAGAGITVLYSTDDGATWSTTEPSPASDITTVQWQLDDPLAAGDSGSVELIVTVPSDYISTGGDPFIENEACAQFGDGHGFACDDTITVVEGSNSIGDTVWQDENGDGILDGGESGVADVTVTLYWDKNGDGERDDGDVLVDTTTTDGTGTYTFDNLPDGDYLVAVDSEDEDLPTGYSATTTDLYAVTGLTGDYDLADFGFGPVLALDKQLVSGDPAYEGRELTYTISLVNTRPGDGSGEASSCQYVQWSTSLDADNTGTGNKAWDNPENGVGDPDDQYAHAPYQNAAETLAVTGMALGKQRGAITSVEVVVPMETTGTFGSSEVLTVEVITTTNGAVVDSQTILAQNLTETLTVDVTAARTWDWSDFEALSIAMITGRSGNHTGELFVDAAGLRVTTDQSCGGADATIATLPLTDTYDADKLSFVSATPAESGTSSDTSPYANTGVIAWDDLGPLYAGQTKVITLTFTSLEPPSNASTTITNTVTSSGATFGDGAPVHNATDEVTATLEPAGAIGDLVWNDNGDSLGTYEPGIEDGIPNVAVDLYWWNGSTWVLTDTQTTDAVGAYLFDGLRDGDYQVRVDTTSLPSGATQNADPDGTLDDQTDVTISGANDVTDADFGYSIPNAVYGNIWEDNDGDGTQDGGENGIVGVTVELYDATDSLVATVTTDADGNYTFDQDSGGNPLPDGDYYVVVDETTLPAGGTWTQTVDPDGTQDGRYTSGGTFAVADGNLYGAYDFAYTQSGSATLGDTLYADWNGDGTQDSPSEEGIADVTVELYEDADGDGQIDTDTDALIATTTTDGSGSYSFANLPDGTYLVRVDATDADLPGDWSQTEDPDGTADDRGVQIVVSGGVVTSIGGTACSSCDLDVDFGYRPRGYGTIGDYLWDDADADGLEDASESGIADVTVRLYEDSNGNGVIDSADALVGTTTTDSSGNYSFTNLPAGDYVVDVDETDTDLPMDGSGQPYVVSTGNDPLAITLGSAETYVDADFGFAVGGVVGDFVWQDYDGDGFQDSNEPGIAGVTVELYLDTDGDGTGDSLHLNDTTDTDGLYEFTGLPPADYVVAVDTGSGALAGHNLTYDPDETGACTTCDAESALALVAGQIDRSRDFGFRPSNAIGDYLWFDTNGDGVQDSGELGIPDVTVELWECGTGSCSDGDETQVDTTSTDADGSYSFGPQSDGTYEVRVDTTDPDLPTVAQTYDADGTLDDATQVVVSGSTVQSVGGACDGDCDMDADFGYQFAGSNSITGTVFHDDDSDGSHAAGSEPTYDGVTVYLWDDGGRLIATTETTGGTYTFDNLPDGDYTVSVNANAPNLTGTSATTATFYDPVTLNSTTPTAVRDFGFVSRSDLGDLPGGYGLTLLNDDGGRHIVPSTGAVYLGSAPPDIEHDGQESAFGDGDDTDAAGNDDDGVVRTSGVSWSTGTNGGSVDVTVGGCPGTCYLSAWIDWNEDGDFRDAGERILLDEPVVAGTQTIQFDVPGTATFGTAYNARFRLYEGGTRGYAQPTGLADNGEVEDYQWSFGPTAVTLRGASVSTHVPTAVTRLLTFFAGLMLGAGMLSLIGYRWKRR